MIPAGFIHAGLKGRFPVNAILCADKNWAIGYHGSTLVSIPSDRRFFSAKTTGKAVVMGRRTYDSLPGGGPLKGRTNIVMSRNPSFAPEGVTVVRSRGELFDLLRKYKSDDIYVTGGGEVFELLLPYCDRAFVTMVDMSYRADTWFPNLDYMPEWVLEDESEESTCFDIEYMFRTYVRKYHTEMPKE